MKTWDHEKLDCNIKNTSANNKSQLKPPHSFQNKAERNMRKKNDDKFNKHASAMSILLKALAIEASIPIISNSISSSVSRTTSTLKLLQKLSIRRLLSTPIDA